MVKIERDSKIGLTGAVIAVVALLIGLIVGITISPQKDYSSCLDLAEQNRLIISQDGTVNTLAISTIEGRNTVYNRDLEKCLELAQ